MNQQGRDTRCCDMHKLNLPNLPGPCERKRYHSTKLTDKEAWGGVRSNPFLSVRNFLYCRAISPGCHKQSFGTHKVQLS